MERSPAVSLKLNAASMICLMVATSFATVTQNTTLLNAYVRHTVIASQDLTTMIADRAGTTAEQQVLSDHLIRLGKHLALLNQNLKTVENAILADPNNFVNGDFSSQIADLQTKLNAMGYQATLQNPGPVARAATLAKIKQYGLESYLKRTGTAIEQLGASYVSPYARYGEPMLMPVEASLLEVVLPHCAAWQDIAGDMFAVGAIAALAGQEELGIMFGASGGMIWLYARYIC